MPIFTILLIGSGHPGISGPMSGVKYNTRWVNLFLVPTKYRVDLEAVPSDVVSAESLHDDSALYTLNDKLP